MEGRLTREGEIYLMRNFVIKLTTHSHLVPGLRMGGLITPFPDISSLCGV